MFISLCYHHGIGIVDMLSTSMSVTMMSRAMLNIRQRAQTAAPYSFSLAQGIGSLDFEEIMVSEDGEDTIEMNNLTTVLEIGRENRVDEGLQV